MAEEVLNSTAAQQLKSIVDRLERIDIERQEATEAFNEVLKEAVGNGFDQKILRKVVRLRKIDRAKRAEEDAITETYLVAIGDGPAFERAEPAQRADTSLGIASITVTAEDGASDTVTPDTLAVGERINRGADVEDALYDQAVVIVRRDGRASTSYIQCRLQLNFNSASAIMGRMEAEDIVGPPNHAGARVILQAEAA